MDKANRALAIYLAHNGATVHLVGHRVDDYLLRLPQVTAHIVPRILNSALAGEIALRSKGRSLAAELPSSRVVANGGNLDWPDINWVHAFHRNWPVFDPDAPLWFKLKAKYEKWLAIHNESKAIAQARLVIANSRRTRANIISALNMPPNIVHTVYLGADPCWNLVTEPERTAARHQLGVDTASTMVLFVGALGYDQNKGFDVLCKAWQVLSANKQWEGFLVVAGAGRSLGRWRSLVEKLGLSRTMRFVGFTTQIYDLLSAADLLVSPVRYESYGLNVHEALCRGVPAIVTRTAGVAERYPADLTELLLPVADDHDDLAWRILNWKRNRDTFKTAGQMLSQTIREFTWTEMSRSIVELANTSLAPI
jgi:glycosyltransferase involved in cell wall biosynthesis